MRTLKEIILDEIYRQEGIHHNITIGRLKNLAKDSLCSKSRFCYENGRLHGADSYWHDHADINKSALSSEIEGFIHHDPDTDTYYHESYSTRRKVNIENHPLIQRFNKSGIKVYKGD